MSTEVYSESVPDDAAFAGKTIKSVAEMYYLVRKY